MGRWLHRGLDRDARYLLVANNSEVSFALKYHESTKHSDMSLRTSMHHLDWDNRPYPFKVYPDLDYIRLPEKFSGPQGNSLDAIAGIAEEGRTKSTSNQQIDSNTLALALFFSAGVTRTMKVSSGKYYMRAAPATGALYPIEVYVVASSRIPDIDLEPGIFHFCPADFTLTRLRTGNFCRELSEAAGGNLEIASAPVTIVLTSIAWRNAWKYQARSYRHWFWDSGVIASNLLAVMSSQGLRVALIMGFIDRKVNDLLLLQEHQEAAVALAPIGVGLVDEKLCEKNAGTVTSMEIPRVLPLSRYDVEYPEIWTIHDASSLQNSRQVTNWALPRAPSRAELKANSVEVAFLPRAKKSISLGEVILKRGSTRDFSRSPISLANLVTVIDVSTQRIPVDFLKSQDSLIETYLIANSVEGLQSGSYYFNSQKYSLEELRRMEQDESRIESGYLCLNQSLFSDASVVFFLMSDLATSLSTLGNRGYRACQFEAGIRAGKLYLAAYSLGLGASGSTFFDDPVTDFFLPHASGKSPMMAVGIGLPAYKSRNGSILGSILTRSQLLAENNNSVKSK